LLVLLLVLLLAGLPRLLLLLPFEVVLCQQHVAR
jgi:hypothetical protein